jgi:hypothetical protein
VPPRILTILGRLRQDLAAVLSPAAIQEACRQENYSWRDRALNPVTTVYLFLLQCPFTVVVPSLRSMYNRAP